MTAPIARTETDVLLSTLRAQRRHVLGILDGLSEDALRRPVLPSGWTCLGMLRHLALDVEQFWFQGVVAGEPPAVTGSEAWQVDADVPAADVLAEYRRETELADAVIAATPLDAPPRWWPVELFPHLPSKNLRETIVHVIVETACHAGHLDAVRELIDGRTWLVLTD